MLGPLLVAASITGALVPPLARREALVHLVAGSSAASLLSALPAAATDAAISPKRKNLPPAELAKLVRADIEQKQFLVSGQLTREIYDESATFTDAIDTCALAASHLERSKARNAVSLLTVYPSDPPSCGGTCGRHARQVDQGHRRALRRRAVAR